MKQLIMLANKPKAKKGHPDDPLKNNIPALISQHGKSIGKEVEMIPPHN